MTMPPPAALWRNARVVTCTSVADAAHPQADAIVTVGGRIDWVGAETALAPERRANCSAVHDLGGRLVTPGLIDCHTHLVFAGDRAAEFAERQRGVSYEEIARRGGGILATVRATRAADEQALYEAALPRFESLLREGVVALEIKSGYGLTLEDEARMLRVARTLGARHDVVVRTSYLAAHAVPPEFAGRADDYLHALASEWLPELVRRGLVDAVDVYCDRGAFSAAQSRALFEVARGLGLPVRMHVGQFADVGGAQVAAEFAAVSCDHLEEISGPDVQRLAAAGTVAVLLPVAYYTLRQVRPPPVELLRAAGVPLAVATDCNPGTSPCASLLLAMNMGCRLFGLHAEEALAGVTCHAAQALGLAPAQGSLAAGAGADFVVWDAAGTHELSYWTGLNRCRAVIRRGALARGAL
ncbi:MAG TPA: imidazolonepropionase [Steroidobacteraceae bacterium]|nr:imidazolonepropionase [Steroidobacteraceae bacterium]